MTKEEEDGKTIIIDGVGRYEIYEEKKLKKKKEEQALVSLSHFFIIFIIRSN